VRIGIVSDIHCNLYGLRNALDAMAAVDEILCLGDCISEYRFSNDVVRLLRDRGARMIQGNHEETFIEHDGEFDRGPDGVDRDLLAWLAEQPLRRTLDFGGKRLLMVHSTPWEPRGDYVFPHSEDLERFAEADADVVLYGHTHAPVVKRVGRVLVVNPGSAGDARYGGHTWQLHAAILDTVSEEVELLGFPDPRY
jgi:putative phosphoesterase